MTEKTEKDASSSLSAEDLMKRTLAALDVSRSKGEELLLRCARLEASVAEERQARERAERERDLLFDALDMHMRSTGITNEAMDRVEAFRAVIAQCEPMVRGEFRRLENGWNAAAKERDAERTRAEAAEAALADLQARYDAYHAEACKQVAQAERDRDEQGDYALEVERENADLHTRLAQAEERHRETDHALTEALHTCDTYWKAKAQAEAQAAVMREAAWATLNDGERLGAASEPSAFRRSLDGLRAALSSDAAERERENECKHGVMPDLVCHACDALRAEVASMREALEGARPVIEWLRVYAESKRLKDRDFIKDDEAGDDGLTFGKARRAVAAFDGALPSDAGTALLERLRKAEAEVEIVARANDVVSKAAAEAEARVAVLEEALREVLATVVVFACPDAGSQLDKACKAANAALAGTGAGPGCEIDKVSTLRASILGPALTKPTDEPQGGGAGERTPLVDDTFDYEQIDAGVRDVVRVLRRHGFRTTDSGDGSKAGWMEGAMDVPMVAIVCSRDVCDDADAVAAVLKAHDTRRWDVQGMYSPSDGHCVVVCTAADEPQGGGA